MELLARRVGADLLEYRHGELVGGSVDELIELGLYEGWVDPGIYEDLDERTAAAGRRRWRISAAGGTSSPTGFSRTVTSSRRPCR